MPGPFHYQVPNPGYNQEPGPICQLIVSWKKKKSKPIRALIDSGAGDTYLPLETIRELNLRKLNDVEVSGAVGEDQPEGLYAADLDLSGVAIKNFPVISNSKRDYAIIGRDFIKRYVTSLSGPKQEFTIT